LNYIKDIDSKWYDSVDITGTLTDMKIMKYKCFIFADIRLMTGGGSLA